MTLRTSRTLWAPVLTLALAGLAAPTARADAISYSTAGSVATPAGATPGLVYFNGFNNYNADTTAPLNLGTFVMSTLAKSNAATYANDPFQILVTSQGQTEFINGVLNGSTGSNPAMTATITSINPIDPSKTFPFQVKLPLNTPMTLAVTDGTSPGMTSLVGASPAAIPEPSSVAVFAVAMGGFGLWSRRRINARAAR
jgi:hypothetical protein